MNRASSTSKALGKAYRFYPSRWARLGEWLVPGRPRHELHWVLRHIGFSVAPGESVGIIGRNGAGKSTLLKLITGTTQPSEGQVTVTGRVAALLELGMGFHPEFTGRENVFMTGQLSGLSAGEIAAAMPQIEAFAEIGRYIDAAAAHLFKWHAGAPGFQRGDGVSSGHPDRRRGAGSGRPVLPAQVLCADPAIPRGGDDAAIRVARPGRDQEPLRPGDPARCRRHPRRRPARQCARLLQRADRGTGERGR